MLLYRGDEFAELCGGFLRRGRCHTWGTSEPGGSVEQLISEGFVLTREWTFDPDTFDFALLEDELVTAMKNVLPRLPGINAFALYTDESAMTIGAAAHCFESLDDETLWWPPEWSLRDDGIDFDVPYRLILSQHRDRLTRVPFETFHEGFNAALMNAMKRIEFGAVVALISVNDAGEVSFIGPESMRDRFNAATEL